MKSISFTVRSTKEKLDQRLMKRPLSAIRWVMEGWTVGWFCGLRSKPLHMKREHRSNLHSVCAGSRDVVSSTIANAVIVRRNKFLWISMGMTG